MTVNTADIIMIVLIYIAIFLMLISFIIQNKKKFSMVEVMPTALTIFILVFLLVGNLIRYITT